MHLTKDPTATLQHSFSESVTHRLWLLFVIGSLVVTWCVLDSWNHDMSGHLFQMSEVKGLTVDHSSGRLTGVLEPFKYTLTLAFLQFAFMGVVFLAIFAASTAAKGESLDRILRCTPNGQWPALVGTHVCGSLLLQSLMMPSHMMSLGVFAATRAVEIPIAAGVRAQIFGDQAGGPSLRTTMLMFAAAWLLFFSYTEIAECLCVWSGFGVALSGLPLYIVYAFLLTIPATNMVLQESALVPGKVNPIFMQGIQNIFAAMVFIPVLFAAQWLGYENVWHALVMITGHRQVYMTVLWLCVQSTCLSAVTVGLILSMDSFWAVAACSLRVVFWWVRQLQMFYITNTTILSVARPHASLWSLVMVCGIVLGLGAWITDSRQISEPVMKEKPPSKVSSNLFLTSGGLGVGKYI